MRLRPRLRFSAPATATQWTHSAETVREAFACGLRVFGENRVEEAAGKIDSLRDLAIEWHMVGQLQTRKAREVPGRFALLHSLDREKLARALDRHAGETGLERVPALVR